MPRSATALIRLLPAPDAAPADAPLLRAFLSSAPAASETAFAELVRRHGPMVLAACRRVLCNSHDAEDAFQGTFLVLARKAGTIHGNLAAWLYAVAVRTARGVRVMRDRRRKHEMRAAANGLKAPANGVGAIGDPELASVVDEEIAKLPEHYREAIVLCELRGLSRKQAATELGIPEGTLSSRLAGGKRRLATLLSARGLAAPAALMPLVASAPVSAALLQAAVSATRGTVSTAASTAAGAVMKAMLFDQLKAVVVTAGIMMTVACGGWAMTSAPGGDHPAPAPRATQDPAALLIAQLGAPDFADREAAQKALRVLGFQAESAIKAGLKSESAETRDRCAKLLNEIRADARDALVKGFNTSSTDEYDHPLWKRFSAIAGKTRASRELFVRIIRNPNWLRRLDAADANPATAAQHYREAIMEVGKLFNYYLTVSFHVPLWPCDRGEEVAYLLLLGSYPNSAPDLSVLLPKDARQFATGEGRIPLARGLELGLQGKLLETFPQFRPDPVKAIDGTDRVFARLLSAWLPQRRNPDVLWGAFQLAAAHGASDVLPFARRAAADRSLPVEARCYALMPIARFGAPADRPLFEALFADETVIAYHLAPDFRSVAPPGAKPVKPLGHVQARDYAAAHLLLLFGENPSDYGFIQARNRVVKRGERLNPADFLITEFAFPTDDDNRARNAAHAKVKAFLDKQSKAEPKKDEPDAAKLVKQLGASEFAEREAAQKALRKLGMESELAIRKGLKSENAEVVKRCKELLNAIHADLLASKDSPVWAKFKTVAGDDAESWKLYMRMIGMRQRAEMLLDAVKDQKYAATSYTKECETIAWLMNHDRAAGVALQPRPPEFPDRERNSVDLAAMFFLGTIVPIDTAVTKREPDAIRGHVVLEGLKGESKAVFGRLLTAWAEARPHSWEVGFDIALTENVTAMTPVARKALTTVVAKQRLPVGKEVAYALRLIGWHGTTDDTQLVLKFADDGTECGSMSGGGRKDGTIVQVRDLAVIAALTLHRQKLQDFGFGMHDISPPWPANFLANHGFDNDTDRAAAHKKAREWLAKQKKEEPNSEAAKLVEQLGAPEFADREAAQKALRLLGTKAEAAIKAGLKSENAEVAKRCRELLDQLAWDEFEARHWPRFAKVVGDRKEDRELFARIRSLKRNVELLNAVAADPDSAGKLYHDRWKELNNAARTPNGPGGYILSAAPLADVVGWMYLGTFPGAEGSFHQSHSLDFLPTSFHGTSRDPLPIALKDKTASVALRRLVGKWTAARIDYSGRDFGLQLALAYDIAEVLPAARETLRAKVKDDPYPGNTARNVGWAMLVLGKLGTGDDLPLLERYAKDETHCATFLHDPPPKPGQPLLRLIRPPIEGQDTTSQLRDVSAAMRLHLCGQKPQEFGFYWKWPFGDEAGKQNGLGTFNLYAIGFLRDSDRAAAHKKAREWLAKQK